MDDLMARVQRAARQYADARRATREADDVFEQAAQLEEEARRELMDLIDKLGEEQQ